MTNERGQVMSYVEDSLGRNERLVYRAHFHWLYDAAAWLLLLAALAGAVFLGAREHPWWIALAALTVGILLFVSIKLPLWAQQIAVTNQRLIHRHGLVSRATEELQLQSVEL